jgi:hypothetical protein
VPGKLTRYGLSEVINHLLDLGALISTPRPEHIQPSQPNIFFT